MLLEFRAAPPFMENGFVLGCEETREGVIVDPGESIEELLDITTREQLKIRHILLTHAHLDHITGVRRAKQATGAPVILHKDDQPLYERIVEQGLMFGIRVEKQPPVDAFYDAAGKTPIAFGRFEVRVHHTPGHSPGGVCLEIVNENRLIVGDTLFAGSIGRTDLPGGDFNTLIQSIRTVLFAFPDDTIAYPGHGEATTIGEERRTNPFLT